MHDSLPIVSYTKTDIAPVFSTIANQKRFQREGICSNSSIALYIHVCRRSRSSNEHIIPFARTATKRNCAFSLVGPFSVEWATLPRFILA